jgi:hypothetical protein
MKVKLFKDICCPDGSYKKGETADLTDKIAQGLIDGKYAEKIQDMQTKTEKAPAAQSDKPVPNDQKPAAINPGRKKAR